MVLWATTVSALLKPARMLLLGNRKFLALEVTVTRRRLPFSKRLENFVVRIWMGYTAPGCR